VSTALATRLDALDALAAARGLRLERDAPVGRLTTLRVGGTADRLAVPRSRAELLATLRAAREAGVPIFLLGKGSDVVVADAGIRGLVIRNRADAIRLEGTTLRAESGAPMASLVRRCTDAGLAGLEFGTSIPGSLGGAVWANAGAHGAEMRDLVVDVDAYDPRADAELSLPNAACAFAYRESRFKTSGEIVLGASLALHPDDPAGIAARIAEYQARRRATQPLADQNAGSVFRNPPGDHAGRLIDAAGLKGLRIGTASVSTLHANFIVTDRGAASTAGRAADVRAVGDHVRRVVEERFGVRLEYEVEFVGDWPTADVDFGRGGQPGPNR
jgi:UDP-N-acetylmuramate dehydrogenase